jgi:hypothetical protein
LRAIFLCLIRKPTLSNTYTIVARSFILLVQTALYFKARDPLFLVLDAVVLIGLLPSIYVAAQVIRARKQA